MKLNKVGLTFSGLYTVWFVLLHARSYFVGTKSAFWLDQFAIAPAQIFVALLMASFRIPESAIPIESWMNSVYVFGLMSLLLCYLFGWALTAAGRLLVRLDGGRLNRLDERVLDRFDRDPK